MVAAVYARKSTDQTGVADEQKSVARQVDHAKKYAAAKGWTVDEASIFVDDGVSAAEFATVPGSSGCSTPSSRGRRSMSWSCRKNRASDAKRLRRPTR
jgi:Resolvase, N terminal domain